MTSAPTQWLYLEPIDVLNLRGNRLFGEAGSFAEALMPPWPSVAAGAIRSRILVDQNVDLAAFRNGSLPPGEAGPVLGTPSAPGSFRLAALLGAWRDPSGAIQPLMSAPADVVVQTDVVHKLRPVTCPFPTSSPLPQLPALSAAAAKPKPGCWLTPQGIRAWLNDEPLSPGHVVASSQLWASDPRVGIAIDPNAGTASNGALFSTNAIAPTQPWHPADQESPLGPGSFGFLAGVAGAGATLPRDGLLRFGGDGRAVSIRPAEPPPQPDLNKIAAAKKLRLLLVNPGIFENGWRLPGLDPDFTWHFHGATARLCAASVPRAGVVSGWDLANWRPKPALRSAPAGSVYWLDRFDGDADILDVLAASGLGGDPIRKCEGFNQVWIGAWK